MKQLQLFYKEERRFFFSLFLLMLVQSFGTLLLPYFLAKIIDEGILKSTRQPFGTMAGGSLPLPSAP